MAIKKHIFHTLRLIPIGIVALVMMCGGLFIYSYQSVHQNDGHIVFKQGGLTPIDLIYTFLEGEEFLQETEEEENQFQDSFKHFQAGQQAQNGQLYFWPHGRWSQKSGKNGQDVHLALPLYDTYCQLKIDC